jgi:hypothetical protein
VRRTVTVGFLVVGMAAVLAAQAGKSATVKNLQMTVTAVERADKASLKDCPPGTNTVTAMARTGEQYSNVTVAFKVLPGFAAAPMKRPTVTAADGKTYNTSVQFVDVGSVPEFSCTFAFRVPEGTKLKNIQIEGATLDVSGLEK